MVITLHFDVLLSDIALLSDIVRSKYDHTIQ